MKHCGAKGFPERDVRLQLGSTGCEEKGSTAMKTQEERVARGKDEACRAIPSWVAPLRSME